MGRTAQRRLPRRSVDADAAVGLTLFFIGAVATNARAQHSITVPAAYLVLAVASLGLAVYQ